MKTPPVVIRRLKTGTEGLDTILGGGLPEFSFNVIAGAPGSGKSTLAHQLMFSMSTPDRSALYFTSLGEPMLKMLRYQQQFAFFDETAIGQRVHFVDVAEEAATHGLDAVLARVGAEVRERAPAFIFIDSFRSLSLARRGVGGSAARLQRFVQDLGLLMTTWEATSFLIGEYVNEQDPDPVFTAADGLIWLKQSVERNSVVRKLEVAKMRGQASLAGLHTFRINPDGVTVFPPVSIARTSAASAWPIRERIGLGVPALDEMMGGGLPRGYSLLVAGPSGSGKSILASAFLAEGARHGERGVIAAFEQRVQRSRGAAVADLIEAGLIGVVDTRAADLSVDEIVVLVLAEVSRLGATRIVIDSLSGFELSLAPTFRSDFRESMARMVSALVNSGASVLMTSELEDRYDDLRFSPYGTAFMTDAIIVQRYIELDSRLQRVLAVVKVRGSAHSNELRLFHIDEHGIHVDAMILDHDGILSGRPRRSAPRDAGG